MEDFFKDILEAIFSGNTRKSKPDDPVEYKKKMDRLREKDEIKQWIFDNHLNSTNAYRVIDK
ncbi:MAG: hypothetical protein K0S51_1126 [Bacillales bacterium]|jgi:hypothetical protein|nr:hypothetical protein [Bacillales bacterium]